MEVVVKRSKRRKKTIQARMIDGKMEVLAPYSIPEAALQDHISHLKERLIKRSLPRDNSGLEARAQHLNHKYFEGKLTWNSIAYSTNQKRRRGSCSVHSRTIRISQKMSEMPRWVEDYVIVHELAHLIEPNHGKRFKALVHRYPLAERAIGFLIASETLQGR